MTSKLRHAPRVTAWPLLLASIATSLGACATSDGPAVVSPLAPSIQVTLPPTPAGVEPCLRKEFPAIPDRALSKADVVQIIGEAKVLDRAKTACGVQAMEWIREVRATFAKPDAPP